MTDAAPSDRTRVRREAHLARYDAATLHAVLDDGLVCHLAFAEGDQPFALPTLYARVGEVVYIHGSAGSRTLRAAATGAPVCLTVTLTDGLVLARSAFEHTVNYRSVMLLGRLQLVDDEADKLTALEAFTEKLIPGRWAEVRTPNRKELAATSILAMSLGEASAKVRSGPPDDGDGPDGDLPVWAGTLPLRTGWGEPIADPALRPGIDVPASVRALLGRG